MKIFKSKRVRSITSMILIAAMLIGINGHGVTKVHAEELVYAVGTVYGVNTSLNCRTDINKSVLYTIPKGEKFYILDQKTYDEETWYYGYSTYNNPSHTKGWVCGEFLEVEFVTMNSDYATQMRNAGFPESYIPYLCAMHNQYPEWQFVPVQTNLDWEYTISKEMVFNPKIAEMNSMVPASKDVSRRTTQAGVYDYYTNTWKNGEAGAGGCYPAGADYIKYRMDPRNYLNVADIFMFESSGFIDGFHTVEGVQTILGTSFLASDSVMESTVTMDKNGTILSSTDIGVVTYAQAIYDACKIEGYSPYLYATRLRVEMGATAGPLISGTYPGYEGYYNVGNFGASGSTKEELIANGLNFAKNRGWNTPYKSLIGGVHRLVTDYIARGQDTIYFQKFHVIDKTGGSLFWHEYMQEVDTPSIEGPKLAASYSDKHMGFVFKIPVYKNMPAKACSFKDVGNPNNYLKTLTLSNNIKFNPVFDGAITSYAVKVPYTTASVTVSATMVASTSKLSGTGSYNLKVGANTITVRCTSQSGVPKDYKIVITRAEASEADVPEFASNKYALNPVVTGITPGTTAQAVKDTFVLKNCSVKILKPDGSENTGIIGNGDRISVVSAGNEIASYGLRIYGDQNGDGSIDIIDLSMLDRYILGVYELSEAGKAAADVNKDGSVDIIDLSMIDRQILGIYSITQ